jgi:hypothetical protein
MMLITAAPWPEWYYIVMLIVNCVGIIFSVGVIYRIHRRRVAGGRAAEPGMIRFIDDLVVWLASYYAVESLVQGPLVISAFFLDPRRGYGQLQYYWWTISVPLMWFPQFFHTYIAAVCYK